MIFALSVFSQRFVASLSPNVNVKVWNSPSSSICQGQISQLLSIPQRRFALTVYVRRLRHHVVMCIWVHFAVKCPRPSVVTAPVYRGCFAGGHWGDLVSKVRPDESANSCARVELCRDAWSSCGVFERCNYECIPRIVNHFKKKVGAVIFTRTVSLA